MLQAGLKGNRAVEPTVWSVISAMTHAFPLQLGPCWQTANSASAQDESGLTTAWLLQVCGCMQAHVLHVNIKTVSSSVGTYRLLWMALCWCCAASCPASHKLQQPTPSKLQSELRRTLICKSRYSRSWYALLATHLSTPAVPLHWIRSCHSNRQ